MHRSVSCSTATVLPFLALLSICSVLGACRKPPQNRGDVVTRMVELQESGHYDDAVRVVQDWMSKDHRDLSQDDFLHLQIAMVYLIKADRKQSSRKESLHNADSQLAQALSIFNSKQPVGCRLNA
jgi:hypothetical protein